ncbi:hypothetical protein RQN30_03085 [Arcanobacterium hippocoleae]
MKNNLINTISALAMSGLLVVSGTGVAQAAPAQATPETTAVSYDDSFLSSSEQNDGTQMQEAIDTVADDLENLLHGMFLKPMVHSQLIRKLLLPMVMDNTCSFSRI